MRSLITILLTSTLLAIGVPSMALESGAPAPLDLSYPVQPDLETMQGGMTLDQAVEQVRRQYPGGKIVSAETRGGTHVIKVLTAEGTVRTVRIPAR